ncbi:MAG: DEAD/DEAH box helicase [Gammaproteobacteria bacterium]|jgi:ATP-dependent RNA helicase RhlE
MSFSSLGLDAELLRAVKEQGYSNPTPVQAQTIPVALEGHDLMAGAQTGTGKTAAFTLPMLQNLSRTSEPGRRRVRALVLAPTRELADQVAESVRTYGKYLALRSTVVYGGMNINPQIRALEKGVDILVATPGRLLDHVTRRSVDLSNVQMLVLDEADRMLDMGFMPAIQKILGLLPKQRQTLLFSATFAGPIGKLAQSLLHNPQVINVARTNAASDAVTQQAYMVDHGRKRELLSYLIGSQNLRQVLVFTRTKRGADRLAKQLQTDGIEATAIHGDKSQGARTRALKSFKRQSVRALVATDVAARGLDIDSLPHVVNFELPQNPEDYVHRIGRTGRGGETGTAISLVCHDEHEPFHAIQKLLKSDIPATVMDGFEPAQAWDISRPPRKASNKGRPRFGKPAGGRGRGGNGGKPGGQKWRNRRSTASAAR